MLLQQNHFLIKILKLRALNVDAASVRAVLGNMQTCSFLEVGVPVEDLRTGALGHVGHQELLQLVAEVRGPVFVAHRAEGGVGQRVLDVRERVVLQELTGL